MARKRYKYVFTRKKHTKGGKLSSILAFASFLLFVGSAICSMMMGGKADYISEQQDSLQSDFLYMDLFLA